MKRLLAAILILGAPTVLWALPAETAPAKLPAKAAKKSPTPAAPVAEAPLGSEELALAERVHVGTMPCELGNTVSIAVDPQAPGYFNLHVKGQRYRMRPAQTSTGAIRLEDPRAGAVWLQLGNKSMLMDQKQGRRLADECLSPAQVAVAEQLKQQPPAQSLLEAAPATGASAAK